MSADPIFRKLSDKSLEALRAALDEAQRQVRVLAGDRLLPILPAEADPEQPSLVAKAARIYHGRQRRARHFPDAADLFGEPAYDILLDLYLARAERRDVSVSSACLVSGCAPTTGLRYVARLVELGLIERSADPFDARRSYLALTPLAIAQMENFLRDG